MRRRVSGIGRNVVIEITEEEDLDLEILNMKRRSTVLSGLYALDDYGSGYSNEGNLITLDPDFIKIDISIIRGIERDPDKQGGRAQHRILCASARHADRCGGHRDRSGAAHLWRSARTCSRAISSAVPARCRPRSPPRRREILREFPNGAEEHR